MLTLPVFHFIRWNTEADRRVPLIGFSCQEKSGRVSAHSAANVVERRPLLSPSSFLPSGSSSGDACLNQFNFPTLHLPRVIVTVAILRTRLRVLSSEECAFCISGSTIVLYECFPLVHKNQAALLAFNGENKGSIPAVYRSPLRLIFYFCSTMFAKCEHYYQI